MENHEKEKINSVLPTLIEVTDCNALLISKLRSCWVIGKADESQLNSMEDMMERNKKLYDILQTRDGAYTQLVEALQYANQTGALKALGATFDTPTDNGKKCHPIKRRVKRPLTDTTYNFNKRASLVEQKNVYFHVDKPTVLFTGRNKELETLKNTLCNGEDSCLGSIIGLGGVGKTELAKRFIESVQSDIFEKYFEWIIWINAVNDRTAFYDFRVLAKDVLKLDISDARNNEKEICSIVDDVYEHIGSRKCLIVFDNAKALNLIKKFFPRRTSAEKSQISILITSQDGNWPKESKVELSGLELSDAEDFVKKGLGLDPTDSMKMKDDICRLVSRLHNFPLAICQAIANINEQKIACQNYGPTQYLIEFDKNPKGSLSEAVIGTSDYKNTAYETLMFALSNILRDGRFGEKALTLLKMMAFMSPNNIPDTVFSDIVINPVERRNVMLLLRRYSILNFFPSTEDEPISVNIHTLVQDVLRDDMTQKQELNVVLAHVLELLNTKMDTQLVQHAVKVWKHASRNLYLSKMFATYPSRITLWLIRDARFNDACNFAQLQLNHLQKCLTNGDDREELKILFKLESDIGYALGHQSKYAESTILLKALLEKSICVLDMQDPVVLTIREHIGRNYFEQCMYFEALQVWTEVSDDWTVRLGEEFNHDSLRIKLYIGKVLRFTNQHVQAIHLNEKALIMIETLDNSYEKYELKASALENIACSQREIGQPDISLNILMDAFDIANNHIPNSRIARTIHLGIAIIQQRLGNFQDAKNTAEAAYKQRVKHLGAAHRWTVNAKMILADILEELGLLDEALALSSEASDFFTELLGENRHLTLNADAVVGVVLSKQNKHEQALRILSEIINQTNFTSSASKFYSVRKVKFYMANSLRQLGNLKEAYEILKSLRDEIFSDSQKNQYMRQEITSASEELSSILMHLIK